MWLRQRPGAASTTFSDKKAARTGTCHAGQIGGGGKAAFGNEDAIGRHLRGQNLRRPRIDGQRLEIAVIDANETALQPQGAAQLIPIVHLDKHIHAVGHGRDFQIASIGIAQRRHDQQHAISAQSARFGDLIRIDHEVLAQDRQVDRLPGRHEVGVGALKVRPVG